MTATNKFIGFKIREQKADDEIKFVVLDEISDFSKEQFELMLKRKEACMI